MKRLLMLTCGIAMAIGFVSCEKNNIAPAATIDETPVVQTRSDEDPVAVRGHVRASGGGLAIQGASVTLTAAGQTLPTYSTTTDANGFYAMDSVAQGSYQLKLSATGYITKTVNLNLTAGVSRADTLQQN